MTLRLMDEGAQEPLRVHRSHFSGRGEGEKEEVQEEVKEGTASMPHCGGRGIWMPKNSAGGGHVNTGVRIVFYANSDTLQSVKGQSLSATTL